MPKFDKTILRQVKIVLIFMLIMLIWITKPATRHISPAGNIVSELYELRAGLLFFIQNCDGIDFYKDENNLVHFLTVVIKKWELDRDMNAFCITNSGYWLGYNLVPHYTRLLGGVDIGYFYGIDHVGLSVRKALERIANEEARKIPLYGSRDISVPPANPNIQYHYRANDNAVWVHLNF